MLPIWVVCSAVAGALGEHAPAEADTTERSPPSQKARDAHQGKRAALRMQSLVSSLPHQYLLQVLEVLEASLGNASVEFGQYPQG
jgi:hypothetical protein